MNVITKELLIGKIKQLPTIKNSKEWIEEFNFIKSNFHGKINFNKKDILISTLEEIKIGSVKEYLFLKDILEVEELLTFLLKDLSVAESFEKAYTTCLQGNKESMIVNDISYIRDILSKPGIPLKNKTIFYKIIRYQSALAHHLSKSFLSFSTEFFISYRDKQEIIDFYKELKLSEVNSMFLYLQQYCRSLTNIFQLYEVEEDIFAKVSGTKLIYDNTFNIIQKSQSLPEEKTYAFEGQLAAVNFIVSCTPYKIEDLIYYVKLLLQFAQNTSNSIMHHLQFERVIKGLHYYKQEQWDEAIFSIAPKIEFALRKYMPEFFTVKNNKNISIYQSQLLNTLLTEISTNAENITTQKIIKFIKLCLTLNDGENIRNKISHGDSDQTDTKISASLVLICLILLLSIVEVDGKFTFQDISIIEKGENNK